MDSQVIKKKGQLARKAKPQEPREIEAVPGAEMLQGICAACQNGPECTLIKPDAPAPMHCGQFQEYPPFHNFTPQDIIAPRPHKTTGHQDTLLGICAHCADRELCTFPRPQGGVWTCDEYVEN